MKILNLILLLLMPILLIGQLSTTSMSPSAAVQNVLLGPGVTVSNISFNGLAIAIGYFNGAGSNLGMSEGVIMTTGTIHNNGEGPHGPNNKTGAGFDNGAGGFGLLSSQIGGAPTYNAAILEFDFVPYSDTVRFNYIFGSEEYPEYVGTQFNDVFGFFISGPGISGLQNIAKLPNGQVVAINNVNAGSNSAFFVNNGTGNSAPQNGSPFYIQYDGFTKVLKAESRVQCGQTYHLIIAIADTGDGILDSGIFLEANSLTSKTPIDITHQLSQNLFNNPNIMAEGCVSTTVTLDRGPNGLNIPLTVPISVSGSATEGVDYSNIPNSVTFPVGVRTLQFSIDAYQDMIPEGQESLTLAFLVTDPCGNQNSIFLDLFINDVEPVSVEISGTQMDCPGDEVVLTAIATGGAPPYTYIWSTGATTSSITVSPSNNTNYTVSVTDACLDETASNNHDVIVPVLTPIILNTTPDIVEICPYLPATLEANPTGGSGLYNFQWSSSINTDLGTNPSINVVPSSTTTYYVIVSDNCGNSASDQIVYTITSPPLTLTISPPIEVCPDDSTLIQVISVGGYGTHYYSWNTGETTANIWVTPSENATYSVSVQDECGTFSVQASTSVTVVEPIADFEISSPLLFNGVPIYFHNLSSGAVSYEWEFGDGNNSTLVNPSNIFDNHGLFTITLVSTNYLGCTDTIQKPINIEEEWYFYIPNTFTPDGDRYNNTFEAKTIGINKLSIAIYNRWGQLVFSSEEIDFEWDGTFLGIPVKDGTYTYKVKFKTNSGREKGYVGHINVIK